MASLIQACAVNPVKPVQNDPQNNLQNDPLIGKIFNTATSQTIDFNTLVNNLLLADVIYLSEKHDNPDQHALQEKIIKALITKGKAPQLGFEFFEKNDTPLLLNFVDSNRAKHSKATEKEVEKLLRKKLGWEDKSEKLWPFYFNLLSLAKNENLVAAGLDLSDSQKLRITRKGYDNLTNLEKKLIFSTGFDSKAYRDYMYEIFAQVHCGMKNPTMQSRLFDSWIARNDTMANSIVELHETEPHKPVVIIIGGGHTEHNLGVMDRVRSLNPAIAQVNLGFVEVAINPSELYEYIKPLELNGFKPVPPFDYIWFTRRTSYQDPCEQFKAQLKKSRLHGQD